MGWNDGPAAELRNMQYMKRKIAGSILPLLLCAGGPVLFGQQTPERIRVQTTLVHVPVLVNDGKGGAVQGLKAEDFSIFDDGVRQQLAFFAADVEPIRIALLLDTSKSTQTVLEKIQKAAVGLVSQVRAQDQAMVVGFDSDIHILCRFRSDIGELSAAIRSAEAGAEDGTRLSDAVATVAQKYLRPIQGRKAIILLTDGQDNGSSATVAEMIRAVEDSGAVVYPVYYSIDPREVAREVFGLPLPRRASRDGAWQDREREATAMLKRLAAESAGSFYRSDLVDLKKTFTRVLEEVRQQYLLAFYPDPTRLDGTLHLLRIELSRPGLSVRARRSYQASAR
jgi:VWFA-related protein